MFYTHNQPELRTGGLIRNQQEFSRILTAAVINSNFRQLLLSNPEKAIAVGYAGEVFHLGTEEKTKIAAIHADNLADFATQLSK